MILWKSKEEPETRGEFMPCDAFRWVFECVWEWGCIQVAHQYRDKSDGVWHSDHSRAYGVSIAKPFMWGVDHYYYDGPHCSFSLGWFHIFWGGKPWTGWCDKCMPPENTCTRKVD